MPKRKRQQDYARNSATECKPVTKRLRSKAPQQQSTRLQQRNKRASETQQLSQLPSPSLSRSLNDVLYRKRRQSDACPSRDHNPSVEESQLPQNQFETHSAYEGSNCAVEYWVESGCWPPNFTERAMSTSCLKPLPTDTSKKRTTSSYSQNVRDGEVLEQYTSAYQVWIATKGLDMDLLTGEEMVSQESKDLCTSLREIKHNTIGPTIFPNGAFRQLLFSYQNRNEAIIKRDITTIIIPPIKSIYLNGDNDMKHIIDEVDADWKENCVLAGPRPRPDLAIGLFSSAFTSTEISKLQNYSAFNNPTKFTDHMYFPFLMCEVKCGNESLNIADRQNMHSSSVAITALLKIVQDADKYRSEKILATLDGQILVFSISHNEQDVRVYGHYASIGEKQWTCNRYLIKQFGILGGQDDLHAIYNFVQNVLKDHAPKHFNRLRDALAAFHEPTTMSFSSTQMALDSSSQQSLQD